MKEVIHENMDWEDISDLPTTPCINGESCMIPHPTPMDWDEFTTANKSSTNGSHDITTETNKNIPSLPQKEQLHGVAVQITIYENNK